jgi:hypothetical protein
LQFEFVFDLAPSRPGMHDGRRIVRTCDIVMDRMRLRRSRFSLSLVQMAAGEHDSFQHSSAQ